MKSIPILLLLITLHVLSGFAQPGYIYTVAGNGTSGFSGDGGPATIAQMGQALGVCVDLSGNIYVPDDANGRIRKVNASTGVITTIAGGGSSTVDGIPATNASLDLGTSSVGAIKTDAYGNLFILDGQRVRKITISTGIISTVAGTMTPGFSGDGGPATAAQISYPGNICFDASGNLYIGDHSNYRIRKVNTSGIISTYAGTGTAGFSGDGGPASAAQFQSPDGLCIDAMGNMYVADRYNYRIRKISPSGIISTYAGSGSSGFAGDGGPASAAHFLEPSNVSTDNLGNLYIADFHNSRVRKVSVAGVVSTFAGGGSSTGTDVPATAASFSDVWGVAIDNYNNIYIPDRNHYQICRVGLGFPTVTADSFGVYLSSTCSGLSIDIAPVHYSASLYIKTWFGDGSTEIDTFSAFSGCSLISHIYGSSGTYTVKHVLYDGSTPVDSSHYNYAFVFCSTTAVRFYFDANSNCIKDSSDGLLSLPVTVEVDSNGVPIDTLSATGGLYYTAYGVPGDIYGFKALSTPTGLHVTCPITGVVFDTLGVSVNSPSIKYIGLSCNTTSGFDLNLNALIFGTGIHDQFGEIFVNNPTCNSAGSSVVTLYYSHKCRYSFGDTYTNPAPTSFTDSTITWNVPGYLTTGEMPFKIQYRTWNNPSIGLLTIGDTLHTKFVVTPLAGDADTSNNNQVIVDTVKGGCDPNEMWVNPAMYILPGAQLTYTIGFANTGNDTAFNIYIMDTLSDNVDPHSLRVVTSSAIMNTTRYYDAGIHHNIVKFEFPNIDLQDSTHHDQCNGMVIFTVRARQDMLEGSTVFNHAGIFFDDNPVVVTDTVQNIIGLIHGGTSVCPGGNDTLTDLAPGGVWSISNGHATISPAGIVTGVSAGIDTITYSVTYGNLTRATQKIVTINPMANAGVIAGSSSVCAGGATTSLFDSVSGGTWSSNATSISSITPDGIATGITAGLSIISYTVSNLCGPTTVTHSLTVNPLPYPGIISGSTSVCGGGPLLYCQIL